MRPYHYARARSALVHPTTQPTGVAKRRKRTLSRRISASFNADALRLLASAGAPGTRIYVLIKSWGDKASSVAGEKDSRATLNPRWAR